jgi:hypothetical protein
VHSSFPIFVRVAYFWLFIAAILGIWAAMVINVPGIWGASRHALTVGFLSTMVFAIGQRVVPAFSGMRLLFSTKAMFMALFLLSVGCLMRVSSESPRLPRLRTICLVLAASFGGDRNECCYGFRSESVRDVREEATISTDCE